ncbi:MAG: hypothetical protein AMS27_15930 [Bacteroides sp. SM23_62_1]|nr:MAG: hypothetical protein AMS27_15930 [Bacteroides sp. SM23_62_1]
MQITKYISAIAIMTGLILIHSCQDDFLEIRPNGLLDDAVVSSYEGVEGLSIGAYSMIDGVASNLYSGWASTTSGWIYGSIRGMEANKGSDSWDLRDINPIQTFSETAMNPYLDEKWIAVYEGISRCNLTISTAREARKKGNITADQETSFINQAKVLRGFYHFEAWRLWADRNTGAFVAYVDEHTTPVILTNTEDIRPNIIEDLTAGTQLPDNMGKVGRFNKSVSQVLLAKALMQMYGDYANALPLLADVEANGTNPAGQKAGLEIRYGDIFDIEYRNGIESIYTVQTSVNDGSGGWNGGWGEVLNFPSGQWGKTPGGGCCGFFQPTQEFVNSFRTSGGLPMPDHSYNDAGEELLRDQGIPACDIWEDDNGNPSDKSDEYLVGEVVTMYDPAEPYSDRIYRSLTGTDTLPNIGNNPLTSPAAWQLLWVEDNSPEVDPRLDWSVGRRGIPYWDWGNHTGMDWIREQSYAGPYSPKKQVYKKSQERTYTEVGYYYTQGWTANGYRMIRYADVLLLKAECEAMIPADDWGLGEVNAVRKRAANPDGFVKEADGTTYAANYVISTYPAFADQTAALKAIKLERKLEMGQEGHRYYDLQRWGDVPMELNRILEYEKTMEWGTILYGDATVGSEDVNFPIPQRQIDESNGKLLQNR